VKGAGYTLIHVIKRAERDGDEDPLLAVHGSLCLSTSCTHCLLQAVPTACYRHAPLEIGFSTFQCNSRSYVVVVAKCMDPFFLLVFQMIYEDCAQNHGEKLISTISLLLWMWALKLSLLHTNIHFDTTVW
jgi:hypothetical protein